MTRPLPRLMMASLLWLGGCGGTTDPSKVDLNGTWQATVGTLGIVTMTLTLVERNSELTATGQWAPVEGGASRTVTGQGLHFGVDLNLVLRFSTTAGSADYTTQGRVEDENSFHLVFPSVESPTRVVFQRK